MPKAIFLCVVYFCSSLAVAQTKQLDRNLSPELISYQQLMMLNPPKRSTYVRLVVAAIIEFQTATSGAKGKKAELNPLLQDIVASLEFLPTAKAAADMDDALAMAHCAKSPRDPK